MPPTKGTKPTPNGNRQPNRPPQPALSNRLRPGATTTQMINEGIPPRGAAAVTPGGEIGIGVAVSSESAGGGTVTARRAGGLKDLGFEVAPGTVGIRAALQHLAKAVNIAFQSDYGENYLESVYQAAIVRNGEVRIIHREFFGFRDNWFGQFGRLLESMSLTFHGPDPGSPEGRRRFTENGPASIRGLFNLLGRKLDLVTEFEDRVPAFVEQMFDRLEASGIITGWDRSDWQITTTTVGLDVLIKPIAVAQALENAE